MGKPEVIIIQGPTGVGKSSVAVDLARRFSAEIINADSMQFYRHLDIGTAKPGPEELSSVRHHLFSVVDPDEHFDAGRFSAEGRRLIEEITSRGNTPLVVGGTGLYIRALTGGLSPSPPADRALRERLRAQPAAALYERLQRLDPEYAAAVHKNDTVRIVRALEVYYQTGSTFSEHHRRHRFSDSPYRCLQIGLRMDREALYRIINRRVDAMMSRGFMDEVRGLLSAGYSPELKSLQSIGYKQMVSCARGEISSEDAVAEIKKQTRRYAKRQLTWFRKADGIVWFTLPGQRAAIGRAVKKFLNVR